MGELDVGAFGKKRVVFILLAKRFQIGNSRYDDRAFKVTGDGSQASVFDYTSLDPESLDADIVAMFDDIDASKGDAMVAHGWVSPERLAKLGS